MRAQDDEGEESESVPNSMATPLQKNPIKKPDKGKQPMNQEKEKEKQQAEAPQIKSNDPNILEKIVTIPDQHANSNKNQEESEKLTKKNLGKSKDSSTTS